MDGWKDFSRKEKAAQAKLSPTMKAAIKRYHIVIPATDILRYIENIGEEKVIKNLRQGYLYSPIE